MNFTRWTLGSTLAALLALSVACGGGGDDDGGNGETFSNPIERMNYDVAYDDDAVVVEGADMADVVSVSEDGKTVTLAEGSDTAESLQEGDVVLVAEHTFGTVESMEDGNNGVVVTLGDATLNQVIKDGTISWSDDIHWNQLDVRTLSQAFVREGFAAQETPEPEATFPTPDSLKFSGEIEGWAVEFELKPTAEKLEMAVEAKYGDVVAVTGEGFMSNFTEETLIKFEDSEFGEAAVRTTELETEMELEWHAFSRNDDAGLTEVTQFTIPVGFDIPFLIGPIPFQFSIKAALQVVPAFEGEASSGGKWKVNYTSSQGFKVDNTLGGAIGRLTGADIDTTGDTVTAGLGPAGFAFGIEFPRFELSVFGGVAMAFVTLKAYSAGLWTPGTTLTADIPPCQMGFTEVSAKYGYALQILGGVGIEAESDIWKQRVNRFLDNPCSLDGGPAPQDSLTAGPGDSEIIPPDDEDEEEDCPDGGDEEPADDDADAADDDAATGGDIGGDNGDSGGDNQADC